MRTKPSGRLITVEGIEGVGKSTLQKHLVDYLEQQGYVCVSTREPGGTPLAEDIRQILLAHRHEVMHPDAELLLLFAARAQHIAQVILPALQRGQWVVCDRFTDASFAYQGSGRGIATKHIAELTAWIQGECQPDLTILLDAPVEVALNRIHGDADRIEREGIDFFERVRQRYLERAKKFPERFVVLNADQSLGSSACRG